MALLTSTIRLFRMRDRSLLLSADNDGAANTRVKSKHNAVHTDNRTAANLQARIKRLKAELDLQLCQLLRRRQHLDHHSSEWQEVTRVGSRLSKQRRRKVMSQLNGCCDVSLQHKLRSQQREIR